MKKTVIFYLLCLTVIYCFVVLFLRLNIEKSYVTPIYNRMNIVINTRTNKPTDIIIKNNETYIGIPKENKIINKEITGKSYNLEIFVNEDFKNEIKDIVIFNGLKPYYFKDFSKFEKEKVETCPNDKCYKYTKYKVPNSIAYNKNSSSYNYKNFVNTVCAIVLLSLSGNIFLFIPYILVFIAMIYYINNKEEIKTPKISAPWFFIPIFIFGLLSYTNELFDYLPWQDEYRTIEYSDPNKSILNTFTDPGNPPIFYILFRFFISIFGISQATTRIFPLIIAILFSIVLWLFLKKRFNTKIANIGMFLAFINVPLIYYAQETRSYILQVFMTPIIVYYLFKIFEENKKQDYIIYGILVAIVSNIHYYEILLIVSNFIYALIYFVLKKRYKDIFKFFLANLIGALFFLPFFIETAFNKALTDGDFNNWIPDINYMQIKKCVFYLFGGGVSLLISSVIFVKNMLKKEKNPLLIYSVFTIAVTIFLAVVLSYVIRPMLVERYLILLSPLFIIFLCSVFSNYEKVKYFPVFFLIWIIFIQANSFEKANRKKGIVEMPLSCAKQYLEVKKPKENIYVFMNLSNPEYLKDKKALMDNRITYISLSKDDIEDKIKDILKTDKNAVTFTSMILPNKKNKNLDVRYTCYFNSTSDMCLWKIENK